jgi:periplasmic protein TonB
MDKINYRCWDDAVFERRNKKYGAYFLRSNYSKYKSFAAFTVLLIFMAGMIGPTLFREKEVNNHVTKKVLVINFNELTAPPPIEKIIIPPKPKVIVEKVKVKKYVAPVVTKEEVKEPEELMTVKEVKETPPAPADSSEGDGDVVVQAAPPEPVVVEPPPEEPVVAIPPQFPGGNKAIGKFLLKRLKYPPVGYKMNMQGTVVVEFTVDMDGNLSDITVVEPLHPEFDNEAIRVVKLMPLWTPGESNTGEKIVAKRRLPIKFVIQ